MQQMLDEATGYACCKCGRIIELLRILTCFLLHQNCDASETMNETAEDLDTFGEFQSAAARESVTESEVRVSDVRKPRPTKPSPRTISRQDKPELGM